MLPYSRPSDHLWTVPGIFTAAITSEQLEVYLTSRMWEGNGAIEAESEEEQEKYHVERCAILQRSLKLAIKYDNIHEVRTIIGLDWVREYLDLDSLFLDAATYLHLDIMVDLDTYGAVDEIFDDSDSECMNDFLVDVLLNGNDRSRLEKVVEMGWFSLENIFVQNLSLTEIGGLSSNALENLRILIEYDLDLNSALWVHEYSEWRTPLQHAVSLGYLEIVRSLVDAGADVNNTPEECSYTALGEAVKKAELEIIQFLIQKGADVKRVANDQDATLLELAVDHGIYERDVFTILLNSGANINGPTHRKPTSNWNTALTVAILGYRAHGIIYDALDAGADINQMGGGQHARTPLQAAAQKGNINITRELLKRGARVNAPAARKYGRTALQAAAQKGNIHVARELLKRGAHVNAPAAPEHGRTALQAACEGGEKFDEMIRLLVDVGANVSACPASRFGRTALQALCSSKNPSSELMTFLIEHGADVNAPAADYGGVTALQGAAMMGNIKMAILLIDQGAIVNAPSSRKRGRMALDGAAEHGRLDTVELLLTHGATCMVPGASGYESAIEFAEDNGHFPIADMLRSYDGPFGDEPVDVDMVWGDVFEGI